MKFKLQGNQNPPEETLGEFKYKFLNPENRIITLTEDINSESALEFIDELFVSAGLSDEPLVILINSGGGEAYSSLAIVDAIQSAPMPTIGLCMGLAGSGAFYALQACTHRVMMNNSILFWHEMIHYELSEIKSASESEKKHKDYKKLNDHILTFFKKRIGISKEDWKNHFENKNDLMFNAAEALKLNLIDKKINKITQLQEFFKEDK